MKTTLAFDVYGTLIDTQGVIVKLEQFIGKKAKDFSRTWRDKQLEYSFRRGLMKKYEKFDICTEQALEFSCLYHNIVLTKLQREELLESYTKLPAFEDVKDGLADLKTLGFRMFAFSNGSTENVNNLLKSAKIRNYFLDIVSVDELKTFKPHPGVYKHFLEKSNTHKNDAWLISSNPFDIIGAISSGIKSAWVQRSPKSIFDPWGIQPTVTIKSISDLKYLKELKKNI